MMVQLLIFELQNRTKNDQRAKFTRLVFVLVKDDSHFVKQVILRENWRRVQKRRHQNFSVKNISIDMKSDIDEHLEFI